MSVAVALLTLFCVLPFTSSSYVIHYTSSGGICGDTCGYHGYGYTWCKQRGGNGVEWGYCSLEEGLEITGKKCATPCDLWGGSYRYCHLEDGNWNYCGLVGRKDFLEYSQENNVCIKHCQATEGSFHCETVHGTERCSPFHDITPTGLPCHTNYRCAKYGHSLYRCQTDYNESMWDHCGRKGLDGCVWSSYESNSFQVEICKLSDLLEKGKVIFHRERQKSMFPPTKEEFKNAVHLIDKISSVTSYPDPGPQETIHFYKQEDIFCKGIDYTSVELHVKLSDESSSPIAHVVFPAFLKSAYVLRLAFYMSLHSTFFLPAYTIAVSFDEPMLCSTGHQ